MFKLKILSVCFSLAIIFGCTKITEECPEEVTWESDIFMLFQNSCTTGLGPGTGCHDAWIHNYGPAKGYVDGGEMEDRVLGIKDMPTPDNEFNIPALTEEELKMINCWIQQGAREK